MNAPLTASARAIMSAACAKAVRPRERLTVSQWADRHRILSSKQSNETGRWRTARNPLLREIMDSMSPHVNVREITCMKPSQFGMTDGPFASSVGFYIEHTPCPVMVFMPTLIDRDTWKVQKLDPMLETTEAIREVFTARKSRDGANTKDAIEGPGFVMFLAGGNSPSSYAQKSVKVLCMDDLDRFPAEVGEEGDPVELARGRLKSFPNSYKFLKASTPTIKDASLIDREFHQGDMRRYHVSCPHCGDRQTLKWSNLRANQQYTEAYYICEHNGCIIEEHNKPRMLSDGVWIPERPEIRHHRSYQWSSLYCPIGLGPSWLDLLLQFKRVHKDPAMLKVFINTVLGEVWEDQTDKLKSSDLAKRAGDWNIGVIPPGCLALTVGIDTQDKWLAVTVLGWGKGADGNMRHWIINQFEIQGDTTSRQPWDELEAFLNTPMVNSYGREMRFRAAGIDSRGHRTEQVKEFVMRTTLRIPVYSLQGSTTRIGRAIAQHGSYPNKNRKGKVIKHGYCVWNVGTEHCKDFIFGNLAADGERQPEERVFAFPQGLEDEYYNGLLSEVYDPEKKRYIPRLGAKYKRNEPLDTLVYAWAIGQHKDVNIGRGRAGRPDAKYWERLEVLLEGSSAPDSDHAQAQTAAPVQTPAPQPADPAAKPAPAQPRKNAFAKDGWGL